MLTFRSHVEQDQLFVPHISLFLTRSKFWGTFAKFVYYRPSEPDSLGSLNMIFPTAKIDDLGLEHLTLVVCHGLESQIVCEGTKSRRL